MTDRERVCLRPVAWAIALVSAAVLALTGSGAVASETCSWSKTPSGADFGTCVDSGRKAYCVSCQFAPRVCVRTPC